MASERHYGLDWLRIGAFGLLILYHLGMFFVPWEWHVKTSQPIDAVAVPMLATNSWRLMLLFVVSGYATRAIVARSPHPLRLAGDRSWRLLIPLIFGMAIVVPPQIWVELVFKHGFTTSYPAFWLADYHDFKQIAGIDMPNWTHLWFVAYLWIYTLALLLLVALFGRLGRELQAGYDRLFSGLGLLLIPVAWLLVVRLLILPGARETHGLFDDPLSHLTYLPGFLFGFALGGSPAVLAGAVRLWKPAAFVFALAYSGVIAAELRWPGNTPIPDTFRASFNAARIVQGWAAVVALIGLAERYLNRDHPIRATLTEAVFPFYIIHQTIIVVTGWWLLGFGLPPLAEFVILLGATMLGCWLFYDLGRRIGWLRPLIGLRRRSAASTSGSASSAAS